MQYNHTIDLDMMRRQSVEIVTHQYDDAGRAVRIRVLADGEPATLPANAQITYSVSKPDGTFCTGACTKEVDGEDTYVVFKLSYQMLILPGRETIDISIRADNASISTMTFINHIMHAAVQADDIESSSEFGQLEIALQGMDEIRDLKEDAEQAVVDAQAVVDGIQSDRTQITTNKTDIAQLKEDLNNINATMFDEKTIVLHKNSTYPSGWRTGYWSTTIGETPSKKGSGNYMCTDYKLIENNPNVDESNIKLISFKAPDNYSLIVGIVEKNTGILIDVKRSSDIVTIKHNAAADYIVSLGGFSSDSSQYINNQAFVDSILISSLQVNYAEKNELDALIESIESVLNTEYAPWKE